MTNSLKILHVVPTYWPATRYGGPIRSVHGLCKALAARGHSVVVMTTNVDGAGSSDVPINEPVTIDGVTVKYFPSNILRRIYWSPSLKRALVQTIASFDLVHLHSVFLWPTWVAARLATRAGVPYVIAPRGMLINDLIQRKNRMIKLAWIRLIERRSLNEAAAIHVTSELEKTEIEKLALDLAPIYCVQNGLEFPASDSSGAFGRKLVPDHPYVLFLSRINWKKGIDRVIKALEFVPDAQLLVAGNDEDKYQGELEKLTRELGVHERVHFLGPVSDDEKWQLYKNAQLFVLPSFSENFGIVVLEAMAMACPVLVTPEVGLSSTVLKHKCGVVVDGEPKALAKALSRLLADAGTLSEMGQRGRNTAYREYSWAGIATRMEGVYDEILSSKAIAADSEAWIN